MEWTSSNVSINKLFITVINIVICKLLKKIIFKQTKSAQQMCCYIWQKSNLFQRKWFIVIHKYLNIFKDLFSSCFDRVSKTNLYETAYRKQIYMKLCHLNIFCSFLWSINILKCKTKYKWYWTFIGQRSV